MCIPRDVQEFDLGTCLSAIEPITASQGLVVFVAWKYTAADHQYTYTYRRYEVRGQPYQKRGTRPPTWACVEMFYIPLPVALLVSGPSRVLSVVQVNCKETASSMTVVRRSPHVTRATPLPPRVSLTWAGFPPVHGHVA